MEIFDLKVMLIKYSGNIFLELHDLSSQPRFEVDPVMSYVNNNKEEGAAMTDFAKYQRHLTCLHRTGRRYSFY